ncbi:MAG: sortase-associated OmpA-like protein PdsO [Colwellia sp.]|nr:sortase-associated OmpA-like protein PdsO [Colwellia sp.]
MKTINRKTQQAKHKLTPAKLFLISSLMITPVISHSAYAFENIKNNKSENIELSDQDKEGIGFGTGVIIGAILGGPVGAFIVGITGTLIAKTQNSEKNINALQSSLTEQESNYALAVKQLSNKLQSTEENHQVELTALEQEFHQKYQLASQIQAENLLMSLQFPTGSSELQPHYQGQIVALSQMMQQSPKLFIDLSGYTDKQGSKNRNQELSIARVNTVKKALIEQGVEAERIQLFAFGEQSPVVANSEKEASFYDRRVVIKLHSDSAQVANNY